MKHSCWLVFSAQECYRYLPSFSMLRSCRHALWLGRKHSRWFRRQSRHWTWQPPQLLTTGTVSRGGRLLGTRWSRCCHPYWSQCCELSHWCCHLWVRYSCGSWTASRFGGIPQMRWDLWRRKAPAPPVHGHRGHLLPISPCSACKEGLLLGFDLSSHPCCLPTLKEGGELLLIYISCAATEFLSVENTG